MILLTIIIFVVAVISAAAVNAEVQRRLLKRGGHWLPSTIKSTLCGFGTMIGVVVVSFAIVNIAMGAGD